MARWSITGPSVTKECYPAGRGGKLKFSTIPTFAAIALSVVTASAANAAPLLYSFSSGSYYTSAGSPVNTPVTGTFEFDPVTGELSNVDYTSAFGHFSTGGEYTPGVDTEIYFGVQYSDNYDVYQLASPLSNGGTVQISSGTHPDVNISAGGSLTTDVAGAVPEAATWAMMIVGMGAIGFAMRRGKVATRVSYAV